MTTLHEAIIKVISELNKPLTSNEIADLINKKSYYKRGDENIIPASQITARVNKYPNLFIKDKSTKPMKISLRK